MNEREKFNYQFLCEIEKSERAREALTVIEGLELSIEPFKLLIGKLSDSENFRPISKVSGRFFLNTYHLIKEALQKDEIADYSPETRFYCWRDEDVSDLRGI